MWRQPGGAECRGQSQLHVWRTMKDGPGTDGSGKGEAAGGWESESMGIGN